MYKYTQCTPEQRDKWEEPRAAGISKMTKCFILSLVQRVFVPLSSLITTHVAIAWRIGNDGHNLQIHH